LNGDEIISRQDLSDLDEFLSHFIRNQFDDSGVRGGSYEAASWAIEGRPGGNGAQTGTEQKGTGEADDS
jgi:hypothetical protein